MPDYGLELRFGCFLTPSAAEPERVVSLAQQAESAGLDLVTFQDHPYQPRFLDAWTLMSYVAARTESITIAPNVLNLPLRPPAVLARAAASLDLLSGGRVELALGAGGFWDAIEAMGGPRRSPGEAVTALGEAIELIRELWAVDRQGGVRVDGEVYRVHGAKRGPAPAHRMGIWLGALGPRMLRLTGRAADGWLVTASYFPPDRLPAANATIDEAASAAGRAPSDVRRLYNVGGEILGSPQGFLRGPVDQWVDELTELALEHGMATFILASDEPRMLDAFASEIAPAVRAEVASARGSGA